MLKSMTGFAKVEIESTEGKLYGEARSLNTRYLEISVRLSRTDYPFEQKVRELIKQNVKRGKVDVTVKWERLAGQPAPFKINDAVVRQYVDMARALKEEYAIQGDLTVDTVFNLKDIITFEENSGIPEEVLFPALDGLLEKLNEERAKEGDLIRNDLLGRLDGIAANLRAIEERWPSNVKAHEEKLRQRVLEATTATEVDESRILQEVAIYMERLDIAEEVVRLTGHLSNFRETIDAEGPVGRKLDFIIQEMVRESNTIGSKSNDLYINERVIQIKVDIEKMREQAQNVE